MDIGIVIMPRSTAVAPKILGRAIEERGFESVFYPEHTHIPLETRRGDGASARDYAYTYDPFVALAAIAAVTATLRVGTAVCLVTQRDPITTAKEAASLDRVSDGRLLFGVGAGWNRPEMANHGTDPRQRMRVLADRVRAMRAIWTADEAEYHGEFVSFKPLWSWPKPVQKPHPPVLVGGNGPGALARVLAYGDGWLPQWDLFDGLADFSERAESLRRQTAEAGRSPVPITVFDAPAERRLLDGLEAAGADRCLLTLAESDPAEAMRRLDEWADLVQP